MVKVSVLIPAHNAAEYVGDAVRSALGQSLREIEVIAIDDASSDDTAAVSVKAAQNDPRFVLLRRATNGGPGRARNCGLERASGEWIALLDADDRFAPERLERLLGMAEQRKADLMADNLAVSTKRGASDGFPAIREGFMRTYGAISAAAFIAMDRPSKGTQAVGFLKPLMHAGFLRANGIRYDERFRNGEDFHFYVQALLRGARLFVCQEAWYRYWFRRSSQCRGSEAEYPQQLIDGNADLLELASFCGDDEAAKQLRKRRKEIECWIPYARFVAALKQQDRVRAMRSFARLPSRTYAVRKLWEAAMRRAKNAPETRLA